MTTRSTRLPDAVRIAALAVSAALTALMAATATVLVAPAPAAAQDPTTVIINEFLAANGTGISDGDGDTSDWIELHNPTGSAINVAGWHLIGGGDTWPLPNTSLAAGGYLLIWASGKDRSDPAAELHTNFKLSSSGEYLALRDADGELTVEHSPAYPAQTADLSYGLGSDGLWSQMTPTPRSANSTSVDGRAEPPVATTGRGVYTSSVTESLSSPTPDSTIRYTTDGSQVTATSPAAPTTFTISPDSSGIVTIRARTYAPGKAPSAEASWSYVFPESLFPSNPETHAGFSSRPVMALYTSDGVNPQGDRVAARLEFIDPETGATGFSAPMGVNEFGESSTGFVKNNYRMFFETEWGQRELEYPLFADFGRGTITPTDTFRRLELRGMSWDGAAAAAFLGHPQWAGQIGHYMSDRWMKDSLLDLGSPAPHGRYVTLFLNGQYWGAYHLRERFDHHFAASYGRGDSDEFEAIKHSSFGTLLSATNGDGSVFESIHDETDYQAVRDWIDPQAQLNGAILESMVLISREREYRAVGPFSANTPGGFHYITNDNDFELGRFSWNNGSLSNSGIWTATNADEFIADEEYEQHLFYYAAKALCPGGPLREAALLSRLEALVDEIEPLMRGEELKWGANAYSLWQSQTNKARSGLSSTEAKLYNGLTNSGHLDGCDLRPTVEFADNQLSVTGAAVALTVAATDPDGDAISFASTSLPPGLSINSSTGVITGTPTTPGSYETQIRVSDSNGKWLLHDVDWTVTGAASAAAPTQVSLALNEYNAVADGHGWVGSDVRFGSDDANGGDWLELVVAADGLDARGYTVELWDRDRPSELLAMTHRFVFAPHPALANLSAGTLITIAEGVADDTLVDPGGGDWHLNAQAAPGSDSALLSTGDLDGFDTNRRDLHVIVRDASGDLAAPMAGETDEWDQVNENVSGAEVMALCTSPVDMNPVTDYADEAATSTFGADNTCGGIVQPLAELRGPVRGDGDTDCDGSITDNDARLVLRYLLDLAQHAGVCSGSAHSGDANLNALAANIDGDESTDLVDAWLIATCASQNC